MEQLEYAYTIGKDIKWYSILEDNLAAAYEAQHTHQDENQETNFGVVRQLVIIHQ